MFRLAWVVAEQTYYRQFENPFEAMDLMQNYQMNHGLNAWVEAHIASMHPKPWQVWAV